MASDPNCYTLDWDEPRYLQDATGMSVRKIVQTLRPLQQVTVRIAGHEHLAEDPLTPTARSILEALDLNTQ